MAENSSVYKPAQDELHELQEQLVERRREYFKSIGLKPSGNFQDISNLWGSNSTSNWKDLFGLRPQTIDFSSSHTPKAIKEHYHIWQKETHSFIDLAKIYREFRIEWANVLKVHPDEIFLTRSTTDAIIDGFRGMNWQKNEICITSNMEHSGGLNALYAIVNRYGMKPPIWGTPIYINSHTGEESSDGVFALKRNGTVLSLPTGIAVSKEDLCGYPLFEGSPSYDEAFFIHKLAPLLDTIAIQHPSSLKALFFSSPTFITGIRLPETQLARWAWHRNLYTLMDGAHLGGMTDVNLHEIGIDFCAISGHKWQFGSSQTGIGYIRRGRKRTFLTQPIESDDKTNNIQTLYSNPTPMPEFWTDFNGQLDELKQNHTEVPMTVTHKEPPYPEAKGLDECCRLWDFLGRSLLDKYTVLLAQYLRWRLSEIRPVTALLSEFRHTDGQKWKDVWNPIQHDKPFPTHCRSGITAWTPFGFGTFNCDAHVDACAPLSNELSLQEERRSKEILSRLGTKFGIFVRTTRCPHQLRVGNGQFSANAMSNIGPVTASSPLRFSTFFYHEAHDIDRLIDALSHPDIIDLYNITS